jgi:hypothetical protein
MKNGIILALKGILLMAIMFVGMAFSSLIIGVHASESSSNSLAPLLIYCILNTIILMLFIIKSKTRGLKLIGTTFIIYWGTQYFMTQIETLYFNGTIEMQLADITRTVISGALSAIIFSSLAVLVLGKFKQKLISVNEENPIKLSFIKLLPNVTILAFSYAIIYFIFGYFVAWQFADLRYYYTGSTYIMNFFQQITNQFQSDPILLLFQVFRGFLWTGLAIIIIRSLGIKNWTTYIITGLLFSVLITTLLIFPNAYMPAPVRLGHSFELFTSMFLFGVLSVIILKNKLL